MPPPRGLVQREEMPQDSPSKSSNGAPCDIGSHLFFRVFIRWDVREIQIKFQKLTITAQ